MGSTKNKTTAVAETAEGFETAAAPEPVVAAPAVLQDPFEDKELLYIPPPMSNSEEKDVVVYVNGRNFIMPKGGTYNVPKCVAAEYRRSQNARARGMKRKTEMVQKEQKVNAAADAVINGKA